MKYSHPKRREELEEEEEEETTIEGINLEVEEEEKDPLVNSKIFMKKKRNENSFTVALKIVNLILSIFVLLQ